ncbi:MAG: hypothetical protein ACREFP_16635 [Acetobacteraceae bacterium]
MKEAAEEWAIRWQEPEGKLISALLGAIEVLGRVIASAQGAIEGAGRDVRQSAQTELAEVREMRRAVEVSLQQARNAELALVVHKEELTIRMINQTLPLFADRLHDALVIRERSWNAESRFRRYALVVGAVLGVFVFGYVLSAWQGDERIAAFDACLVRPLQAGGHFYCDIDSWFPPLPEVKK